MAELCKACAVEIWGKDVPSDFENMAGKGKVALVLCEGCGPIYVNSKGNCVSECLKAGRAGHGGVGDGGPEYEDGPWAEEWEERSKSKISECLTKALAWWEDDIQYMTEGEYGEYNVFDDDPEWVIEARKLLDKEGGN